MRPFLILVSALSMFVGCATQSSNSGQGESEGADKAEPSPQAVGNLPVVATMGESEKAQGFTFRALNTYVTDDYYYLLDPSKYGVDEESHYSRAGRFVVVNYSVTNTGTNPIEPDLGATLQTKTGDLTERYDETEEFPPPAEAYSITLAPREVGLSQFIFDVPSDAEPQALAVSVLGDTGEATGTVGAIDLNREDPTGPRPEEILGLQYQYANMEAWERAYDLFADQSKSKVSLGQYADAVESENASVTDYSFPSVEVSENAATVERVITVAQRNGNSYEYKATQELVDSEEGWRIIMGAPR